MKKERIRNRRERIQRNRKEQRNGKEIEKKDFTKRIEKRNRRIANKHQKYNRNNVMEIYVKEVDHLYGDV